MMSAMFSALLRSSLTGPGYPSARSNAGAAQRNHSDPPSAHTVQAPRDRARMGAPDARSASRVSRTARCGSAPPDTAPQAASGARVCGRGNHGNVRSERRPRSARGPRAVGAAYLRFATELPALYQAMFDMPTDVPFASHDAPEPLRACFGAFTAVLPAGTRHLDLVAEVIWSALHGLVALACDAGRCHRASCLELVPGRLPSAV